MTTTEKALLTLTVAALLAVLVFYGQLVAIGLPMGWLIAGLVLLCGAAIALAEVTK